jgi:hypothetical protein
LAVAAAACNASAAMRSCHFSRHVEVAAALLNSGLLHSELSVVGSCLIVRVCRSVHKCRYQYLG